MTDQRITVRLDADTAEDLQLLTDTYGGQSAAVRQAIQAHALKLSAGYVAADRQRTQQRTVSDTPAT